MTFDLLEQSLNLFVFERIPISKQSSLGRPSSHPYSGLIKKEKSFVCILTIYAKSQKLPKQWWTLISKTERVLKNIDKNEQNNLRSIDNENKNVFDTYIGINYLQHC